MTEKKVSVPNCPSNSYKDKKEKKVLKSEVKTEDVKLEKKSIVGTFLQNLIVGDMQDITNYVIKDVMIPAVKDAVCTAVTGSANIAFNGNPNKGSSTAQRREETNDVTSYSEFYRNRHSNSSRGEFASCERNKSYDAPLFRTEEAAGRVLRRLKITIEEEGSVSIGDFYQLCGIPDDFTDEYYGWFDLTHSRIARVQKGYKIIMPKPVYIL